MSNSEGSSNRVPIFGCRKRQRAPLFAETIDIDFGLDDEDDLLFGGDVNDGKRQIVQGGKQQRQMVGCNDGTSYSYQSGTIFDEGPGACDGRISTNSNNYMMDNSTSMNNNPG